MHRWITSSVEETVEVGRMVSKNMVKPLVLCFLGDLGVGKTMLMKGVAAELTGIDPRLVNSPTFTYLNIYEGKEVLYHFDLYRLTGIEDFLLRGFDEYFEEICCIEWADKIKDILPKNHAFITLKYLGKNKREIVYEV